MQWHMPMGYKVIDGKITVYEEHRKIVEQIFRDYDTGIAATRIAARLKEQKTKNAHDKVSWTHVSIGKILENHNYLGTEYYPQIIGKELFDRVQKRRKQTCIELGHGKYRPGAKERILFSGVLICTVCGTPYSRIQPRHKNYGIAKWKCKNYVYHNQLTCAGGFISDQQAMEVCIHAINQLIRNQKLLNRTGAKTRQVSKRFRELNLIIEEKMENPTGDMIELLYERAAERYKTLEIEDTEYKTEEMLAVLKDSQEVETFDEDLYRKLIKQIVVYKDNSVKVIFYNGSSTEIGYGEYTDIRKGEENGKHSSKKEDIYDSCQFPV